LLPHFDLDRPDDFRARTFQQLNQTSRSLFGFSYADADTLLALAVNSINSIVSGSSISPDLDLCPDMTGV
jgi:hypothetical protein